VRWIVYETRCLISGKIYVGVHSQDGEGFDGYFGSGSALGRAIKKHGVDAFERRTLFEFATEAEAYAREAEIVTEEFCRRRDTYNIKTGGMGGSRHSPESRERMSESKRGRKLSPEHRAKLAESLRGRKRSPEVREKISESQRGRELSPEHRAKLAESRLGRKHSPETREKISESQRGRKLSPEHIAKKREAALRYWARKRADAP
jgi:group I intron endonuclease